jgi:hypothetical protein
MGTGRSTLTTACTQGGSPSRPSSLSSRSTRSGILWGMRINWVRGSFNNRSSPSHLGSCNGPAEDSSSTR